MGSKFPKIISKVVGNLRDNISKDRELLDWGTGYFQLMLEVSKRLGYEFKEGDELLDYTLGMIDKLDGDIEKIDDDEKASLRDFCSYLSIEASERSMRERGGGGYCFGLTG